MKKALIVLSKAPIPKLTKTRLCPPLNYNQSARLHNCFLKDTLHRFKKIKNVDIFLSYTPRGGSKYFKELVKSDRLLLQKEKTLGNKLSEIFKIIFLKGYRTSLVMASDSPDLPVKYIEKAISMLEEHRKIMVIGPCLDKGFYLIGLNHKMDTNLFANIDWGMEGMISGLAKTARMNKLRIKFLPVWYDVDDIEGLIRLTKNLSRLPDRLIPRTKEYIFNFLL